MLRVGSRAGTVAWWMDARREAVGGGERREEEMRRERGRGIGRGRGRGEGARGQPVAKTSPFRANTEHEHASACGYASHRLFTAACPELGQKIASPWPR
jgi:hypothetical protein